MVCPQPTSSFPEVATATWTRLRPVAMTVQHDLESLCGPVLAHLQPHMNRATAWTDKQLESLQPWQIALLAIGSTWVVLKLLRWLSDLVADVRDVGVVQTSLNILKSLPILSGIVRREVDKVLDKVVKSMPKLVDPQDPELRQLPVQGLTGSAIRDKLNYKASKNLQITEGSSKVSGALYMAGKEHLDLLLDAYGTFSHTNPLHTDVWPSMRQLESDVIAMTASMLGGGVNGNPDVCGAMTGGGSESILTMMKACRDYSRFVKGIRNPEMIIGDSAHAAYFKGAEYFKIKLVMVAVGADYRLSGKAVRKAVTRNTILVIASAPGFPHGVVDHIEDIAQVTRRYKLLLHVDACLGGFVLPFARKLGYPIPPFDFSVRGVTSMSVDTHKFGMAHKGTSVVLYHSKQLRQYQYTKITEWTGGLYISPGFAGSRSGALIATAWSSLVHMGEQGFMHITHQLMQAAQQFAEGVKQIDGLEVVGNPDMCLVAIKSTSKTLNIYKVNDLMSQRGWHLNALQFPSSIHMCFTAQHTEVVPDLLKDLRDSVRALKEDPNCVKDGKAPVYGMANINPDRSMVGEILVAVQDNLLD